VALDQMQDATVMGAATGLQFFGMLGIAALLAWVTRRPFGPAFALRRPRIGVLAAGLFGGLVVGVFPGWIAEQLMEYLPALDFGNLQIIERALVEGSLGSRLPLLFAVVVLAPLVEELIFRGFLFDALTRPLTRWGAWIATSVLFAAYHVDPVHVIAVLFTGMFLGWLRLTGASIWPCVLAHAMNNGLAACLSLAFGEDLDAVEATALQAALMACVTLAIAGGAWVARVRHDSGGRIVTP
jgi:membrane protease YdiL (CAAX protease family)